MEQAGRWWEAIAAPVILAAITVLLITFFQQQLLIPEDWLKWIFAGTVMFGIMSYLLLHAYFSYAENNVLVGIVLSLIYALPILAYFFSSSWTPLVERDEQARLVAVFVATLFAYQSIYSILFLGLEKFFKSGFDLDINSLGYIFPGFGVELDEESKARSWLTVPAAFSLPFSLTLAYYLIDLAYPYSLFDYRIAGTNQPADVFWFVFDETFRAIPIADIGEIWDIKWSELAAQPENFPFRVVRTLTNITLGIAVALLIIQFQSASTKGKR